MFIFSIGFAQNVNQKTEVKTTTTSVKNNKGTKKVVKTVETKEVQKIKLEEEKPNTLNIPMKTSQVDVTTKTKVSINGVTKYTDVDHSAYYMMNGNKYQISGDKIGYTMTIPDGLSNGVLRRTSNNNYIFKNNNRTSYGYFDGDGNLILETYDEKTDEIIIEKYDLQK